MSATFVEQLDEAIHSLAHAHRACLQLREALNVRAGHAAARIEKCEQRSCEEILSDVAEAFGLTIGDLREGGRTSRYVVPRHEAMYEARRHGFSYPEIARELQRNHSTVIHGVRAAERRRRAATDEALRTELARRGGRR